MPLRSSIAHPCLGPFVILAALRWLEAKVILENTQTGIAQATTTDQDGNYQILNVPIGTYRLSGEATGFKRAVAAQFTVTVGARQRVDLSLQVGDVAEQIVVNRCRHTARDRHKFPRHSRELESDRESCR